jgi:hypothetical protein
MRKRRHDRDGAGFSAKSWVKHQLVRQAVMGQVSAYHHMYPTHRFVIIDMHAGTGIGQPLPQQDLFLEARSRTTADVAVEVAQIFPQAEVILCELKRANRRLLAARYPGIPLLGHHREVLDLLPGAYRWAMILNDPCGYSFHGIEVMEQIAQRIRADWVIVFNQQAFSRMYGVREHVPYDERPSTKGTRNARPKYVWMADHTVWGRRLATPITPTLHTARSRLFRGSGNFGYHIFVVSYKLSDAVKRRQWETIL